MPIWALRAFFQRLDRTFSTTCSPTEADGTRVTFEGAYYDPQTWFYGSSCGAGPCGWPTTVDYPNGQRLTYVRDNKSYSKSNGTLVGLPSPYSYTIRNSRGYTLNFHYRPYGLNFSAYRIFRVYLTHDSDSLNSPNGSGDTLEFNREFTNGQITALRWAKSRTGFIAGQGPELTYGPATTFNYRSGETFPNGVTRPGETTQFFSASFGPKIYDRRLVSAIMDGEGATTSYAYTFAACSGKAPRPTLQNLNVDTKRPVGESKYCDYRDTTQLHPAIRQTVRTNALSNFATTVFDVTDTEAALPGAGSGPGLDTGAIKEKRDELGRKVESIHDGFHRLHRVIMPEGNETQFVYDARGNITSTVLKAKPSSGDVDIATSAVFPATCDNPKTCNKALYTLDARGLRTDYNYDPTHGQMTTITGPADQNGIRPLVTLNYTALAAPGGGPAIWLPTSRTEKIDASTSAVTSYEYDGGSPSFHNLNQTAQTIDVGGLNLRSSYRYDRFGRRVWADGPRTDVDDVTQVIADDLNRPVLLIDGDPDGAGPLNRPAKRLTYDDIDRVIREDQGTVQDIAGTGFAAVIAIDHVYNRNDDRTRITGQETATQFSYDVLRRPECVAVRMNPQAFSTLPASACTMGVGGSFGPDRITKNSYDAVGQLLKIRRGVDTSLEQDYASYSYSDNGMRTNVTDANGNRASMSYDGHDRQTRWNFPSNTATGQVSTGDYESYGYDASGNLTTTGRRDGRQLALSYDGLNRLIRKLVPDTCAVGYVCTQPPASAVRDVYYGYDLRGLQTYARFDSASGADAVINTYDRAGRMLSSTVSMGGSSRMIGYRYDATGNRTRVTHPDGIWFNYGFDGLNRMTTVKDGSDATLVTYNYDAIGRLASRSGGSTVTSFGYDGASRLTSTASDLGGATADRIDTFAYSPANQIVSRTRSTNAYQFNGHVAVNRSYSVNRLNQYDSAGSASFTYDANGNLRSSNSPQGSFNYIYSPENRLVNVTGASNVSLVYDPLGRLFRSSGSSGTTEFLYDGDGLLAEYDGAGNLTDRYVHGQAIDEPLIWFDGADRRWLHADHQGSIVAVTNSSGAPVAINRYDEYGIPGADNTGRFQFTGQLWLPELGMYHYKARIYSPNIGRFLQTDPIGYDDQINLYAYVANDPVNNTDPTGLCGNNGRHIAGCTVFKDDPGKIPSGMTELSPSSVLGVNGHAIIGDGSPRAVDFSKVDLSDLGGSVQTLATQDGQLKDAISGALSSGEPQSVHLTGVRAGGGFEGKTSLGQKAGIGRFSVQIDGIVRPNLDGQWYLYGRVRGEVDRQDYPSDSRRTGIGPAGNALGDRLQRTFGGGNYDVRFYGSQTIIISGWPR